MKTYWRSIEELADPNELRREEARQEAKQKSLLLRGDERLTASSRRDFLKTLGFSLAAASIVASCRKPVEKAIPYLVKPEEITPGMANYYASTYFDGTDYGSILVKVRDGRPIKIEGNSLSPVSQQGTSARIQASVLNLYDEARFKGPLLNNNPVTWETADREISAYLDGGKGKSGKTVLLTSTIISPSTRQIIRDFISGTPKTEWIQYDASPASGMLSANKLCFGQWAIPDYRFDKARVVVSFAADFLGTWLSPVEYTKRYSAARQLRDGQKEMLRHYQIEAGMSLTGANADVRFPVKPSEEAGLVLALYNEVAKAKGARTYSGVSSSVDISGIAVDLLENKGKSVVISGSNDENIQVVVNAINQLLGNYGETLDWNTALLTRQGLDPDMERLLDDLKSGQVSALLVWDVNPVFNHPKGAEFAEAIEKLGLSVSFSERKDETSAVCKYVLPEPNYLESWNDFEPKSGIYSLAQPTIAPIFDSRPAQESLLKWMGKEQKYHEYIQKTWAEKYYPRQSVFADFRLFWNDSLQKGVFELVSPVEVQYNAEPLSLAAAKLEPVKPGVELVFYESVAMGNGKYANNPWLQELPDPVAKISWDNFAAVPVEYAAANGLKNEDVINLNGLELPVFVQPGQAKDTVSVALGYGRRVAGKVGEGIGTDLYPMLPVKNGIRSNYLENVTIEKVPGTVYELAISQTHHSMEGRPIVRETTLDEYVKNPEAGNEMRNEVLANSVTLYEKPSFNGHHWGMAVDLNSCTGCGNCAISCQAENNIQVIGKEQVRNRRIMHWIRIDRYFSESPDNPQVSFQPVMCQHCDNAPCENVCPVAATPHSEEGLNQMAYNRCVGTKYCINNCPYRVRRFNWFQYVNNDSFDYNSNSELGRMVLNPDVTVRSRGVVEKCSMCVQRIQEKKLAAKLEERPLAEGEIQTACQQSCPGNAIVFGDLNDPESRISKLFQDKRNYHLLEELHTLPSVGYLTKVRNQA